MRIRTPILPASNIRRRILLAILPFIILFLGMLVLDSQVVLSTQNDDAYFTRLTREMSFSEFITFRYARWTGRLFTETAHYLIFSIPLIYWKILNATFVVLQAFGGAALLWGWRFWQRLDRSDLIALWFLCMSIGWIDYAILSTAVFWVTGSLDYLWPMAMCLLALVPFAARVVHTDIPDALVPTAFLPIAGVAGICASLGVEQSAMLLISLSGSALLLIAWRERQIDWRLGILFVCFGAALIISLTAPGNKVHYQQTAEQYYPEFINFSWEQHIYQMGSFTLAGLFNRSRLSMALLLGLLVDISAPVKTIAGKWLRWCAIGFAMLLLLGSINLAELNKRGAEVFESLFFDFPNLDVVFQDLARYGLFNHRFWFEQIPLIVWGSAIITMVALLFTLATQTRPYSGSSLSLIFLAGLATLSFMALSPSLFASGPRTAYVFNIALLFINTAMIKSTKHKLSISVIAGLYFIPIANLGFAFLNLMDTH